MKTLLMVVIIASIGVIAWKLYEKKKKASGNTEGQLTATLGGKPFTKKDALNIKHLWTFE